MDKTDNGNEVILKMAKIDLKGNFLALKMGGAKNEK